ncbi:hypothetical protein [Motiliproteus sp. SC1-56]|uniref:hypothetical protein n=1 Tax=Motiliproteus sp. SC1-56 TaxID=2799565 RepID=UPI001A907693|nr:hypothetical protein [Motiliproteus sp. SC1-56]
MFGDKPLFSRRQLNILMVAVTLAIALLANLDDDSGSRSAAEVPTERAEVAGVPVYWSSRHRQQPSTLINLALPAEAKPQRLYAVLQELTGRLPAEVKALRYPDRWTVLLPGAADLASTLSALAAPLPDNEWQTRLERQRTQRYLQGALPAQALTETGGNAAAQAANLHRRLLSRAQLSLSLSGTELNPASLEQALMRLPAGEPWPARSEMPEERGPGLALPGRHSPDYPETALTARLLTILAEDRAAVEFIPGGLHSRLRIRPLQGSSDSAFKTLRQRLETAPERQLEGLQQQFLSDLQARLEDPEGFAYQQGVQAFYRLPLDYWPGFVARIEALSASALTQRALDWLDRAEQSESTDDPKKPAPGTAPP